MREVIFNNGLKKIGINAFYNCESIESTKLPSTVTEICDYAFSGCSNLREVELNGRVKRTAFDNCDELERFLFPAISYRLDNIIQTGHWEELEDKLNEVRGVVQWKAMSCLYLDQL